MKSVVLSIALLFLVSTFAEASEVTVSRAAKKVIKKLTKEDVRTVVTLASNDDDNPCMAEGESYVVDVQVRKTVRALDENEDIVLKSEWETVRTLNVGKDGSTLEVCLE